MFIRITILIAYFLGFSSFYLETEYAKPCFGVNINVQTNSQILTFAAFFKQDNKVIHKRILRPDEMIYFLSGEWPSVYNPERKNYLLEHHINGGISIDSFTRKKSTFCVNFDSLWKVRYPAYPFRNIDASGWANGPLKPTVKQQLFLHDRYGIKYIEYDFFMDTSFWLILQDVTDSSWIKNYKSLK